MLQKYISHTQNFEKEKSAKHRKIGKNTIKMHKALQTYTHTHSDTLPLFFLSIGKSRWETSRDASPLSWYP